MTYQPGDIILVHNKGWLSWLIRKVIKCDYNHTGIFIADNEIVEATFKGVYRSPLSKFTDMQDKGDCSFIVKRYTNSNDTLNQDLARYARGLAGSRYAIMQLIGLAIMFLFHMNRSDYIVFADKHAYTCSELVSECYFVQGINLYEDIDYENITPADIFNSDLLTTL